MLFLVAALALGAAHSAGQSEVKSFSATDSNRADACARAGRNAENGKPFGARLVKLAACDCSKSADTKGPTGAMMTQGSWVCQVTATFEGAK